MIISRNMLRQEAVESMTKMTITNRQVASLAEVLSVERDAAVQFVIHGARDVDDASLRASYVITDRHLAVVRSQSAWPSGDPAHLSTNGDLAHLVDVEVIWHFWPCRVICHTW